jgi:hypothetical protein
MKYQSQDMQLVGTTIHPRGPLGPNFVLRFGSVRFLNRTTLAIKLLDVCNCGPTPCILNPGYLPWNNVKSTDAPVHCPVYGVGMIINE